MKLDWPRLTSSIALGAVLAWLFVGGSLWSGSTHSTCTLEVWASASHGSEVTVRLDEGHGLDEHCMTDLMARLPAEANLPGGPGAVPEKWSLHRLAFSLPPQRIRSLKLVFSSVRVAVISTLGLKFDDGRSVDLWPVITPGDATALSRRADGWVVQGRGAAGTAALMINLKEPLLLSAADEPAWYEYVAGALLAALLLYLLQRALASRSWPRWEQGWNLVRAGVRKRPILMLLAAGLCASLASSFPVAFCGKSFISPGLFPFLLYSKRPGVHGAPVEPAVNVKGSDIAATMVYCVPNSAVEYDAIFHDHEFPLWNRYTSAGLPLFGQGQSMLGNPVHLLGIMANAASWAWDLKYLLAKAIFAFGIGVSVWLLIRRLSVALLLTLSSAWLGFFAYRLNHPAFFSLSFAPWVFVPWLTAASVQSRRGLIACLVGLIAGDWCELTSGTAKEACMLLLFLNFAGLLLLMVRAPKAGRWPRLGVMLGASVCFLLLSAPDWVLFLDGLAHGISWYDTPAAYQLYPSLLIGFFDDIFSQDFSSYELHTHPSANFLVLTGLLWLAGCRVKRADRGAVLALVLAALPTAVLVFAIIPPDWLKPLPFIGHIYHIFNTFGLPLIVLLFFLAAFGLRECLDLASSLRWRSTYARALVGLGVLLAVYLGVRQADPPFPLPSFDGGPILHSRFFLGYAPALLAAVAAFPWSLRWLKQNGALRSLAGLILLTACFFVFHFRHGMYVSTRLDNYVITPRSATNLDSPSPALETIRARLTEPGRVAGISLAFGPDYASLARLEGFGNIDAFSNRYYIELTRAARFPSLGECRPLIPPGGPGQFLPFLDLLNIRYYVREIDEGQAPVSGLTPVGQADLEVYESRSVWPRAFFTDSVASYSGVDDFVRLVREGDGRPFAARQDESKHDLLSPAAERKIIPASDYRLTSNTTEFTVTAPGPGVIVLSEAFEEGNFRVTVNGASAPWFRANHAFKGVQVDQAGRYRIRFEYRPHLLTPLLVVAALGALGSAAMIWWLARRPAGWAGLGLSSITPAPAQS